AHAGEQRWAELARRRMEGDYRRVTGGPAADLGETYAGLLEEYDRGGLPYERCLTRLGYARWLRARGLRDEAAAVDEVTLDLARRHRMRPVEEDVGRGGGRP